MATRPPNDLRPMLLQGFSGMCRSVRIRAELTDLGDWFVREMARRVPRDCHELSSPTSGIPNEFMRRTRQTLVTSMLKRSLASSLAGLRSNWGYHQRRITSTGTGSSRIYMPLGYRAGSPGRLSLLLVGFAQPDLVGPAPPSSAASSIPPSSSSSVRMAWVVPPDQG